MHFDPQSNHVPTSDGGPLQPEPAKGLRSGGLTVGVIAVVVAVVAGLGGWIWYQSSGGPASAEASAGASVDIFESLIDEPATGGPIAALVRASDPQPEDARHDADAVAEEPTESEIAFEKGRVLASVGRHADAVPYLARAVDLDPEFGAARYRLGLSYVLTGRRDAARAQKKALDEIDPSLANLLANLIQ